MSQRWQPDCLCPEYRRFPLVKGQKFKGKLTIRGELDKLAANISTDRNMAGVHCYFDYFDWLRMGERVAVGILIEQASIYGDVMNTTFESFDGDYISIHGEGGSCPVCLSWIVTAARRRRLTGGYAMSSARSFPRTCSQVGPTKVRQSNLVAPVGGDQDRPVWTSRVICVSRARLGMRTNARGARISAHRLLNTGSASGRVAVINSQSKCETGT